ncbi:hypothetical protein [Novosphingobium sp. AAP1]|uniref:hypothetical protein n=1 Tax=Novosphingobium sp. AAP1 TaxID=1523413 RepID=UPI00130E310E|nr:hypothetical protein [Novosphingobium sp. AAP1]
MIDPFDKTLPALIASMRLAPTWTLDSVGAGNQLRSCELQRLQALVPAGLKTHAWALAAHGLP